MSRRAALMALMAFCFALPACQKVDKRVTKANFDKINSGMTLSDVQALLGPGEANPDGLDVAEASGVAGAVGVTTMDLGSSRGPTITWYRWGNTKTYIAVCFNKDNKVTEGNFKDQKGLK